MLRVVGVALGLICLLVFTQVYQEHVVLTQPRKARYYCAFSPQDYDNETSLNQTKFLNQLDIVVDLGFDGVVLHRVESFYDEGLLDWVLEACDNRSLDVMFAIYYFNRTLHFPFPKDQKWNKTGFMTSDAELNLYVEWLQNVSSIAAAYPNFKGYILFYVFQDEMRDWWKTQITTVDYQRRMQLLISTLKTGKPLYLTAEPWGKDVIQLLPKNFINVDGFGLQAYNLHAIDNIEWDYVTEQKNYWDDWFSEIHIAEFGYRTTGEWTHGFASSEQSKAEMIREFIRKTWSWNSFVTYCFLEDFILQKADFGLIYDNQTLKISAYAFKEMLKNESS